jgi:putative endonuclease
LAIAREKQLKGWKRVKKEALINTINPEWVFLEEHPDHEAWG